MRSKIAISLGIAVLVATTDGAAANQCPANPNAIGTTRILTVNPSDYPLVGKTQYRETLPLRNREVVLTFDDGPVGPYTDKILEALAAECVRATFFVLGVNVAESPDLVRRVRSEGHTIGTHTFNHPYLGKMPFEQAKKEIDLGITATTEALGNPRDLAPFFRAPYLDVTREIERYLFSRRIMLWSIDVAGEDWLDATEERFVGNAVTRLEKAQKGILLLHDMQPLTARALPNLLATLKLRNFRIVHVVPAPSGPQKSSKVNR
jgi:peptidoglycan/xylan/chitin deacetylase (PgdA/CDA1 family)